MKHNMWKNIVLAYCAVLALLLTMSACVERIPPSTVSSAAAASVEMPPVAASEAPAQVPAPSAIPMPERTASAAILLDGEETEVYLEVSDGEISFWDQPSGGSLVAVAKFPEELPGAAEALCSCDYVDLDNDGNSDLTASFQFADGSSASLVWFFGTGGFIFNEEFSQLPGDASRGE